VTPAGPGQAGSGASAPPGHGTGPAEGPAAPDAGEAKVIRSFFRDGRLVSIPAREKKKLVVLRHIPGVTSVETSVTAPGRRLRVL